MYLPTDIKKINNALFKSYYLSLLFIAIVPPLHRWLTIKDIPLICKNGFLYWLLADSASWGGQIYNSLFFIFPILASGLIFYNDSHCSVLHYAVIRGSKTRYLLSKIVTVFFISTILTFLIFIINLIVVYSIFPFNAPIDEQFMLRIPNQGSFAWTLFSINPLVHNVFFCAINAITIGTNTIFVTATHMIVKFKNRYTASIVPVIILYFITFCFEAIPFLNHFNLRLLIQPSAHWAMYSVFGWYDLLISFIIHFLINTILIIASIIINKDVLV